MTLTRRELFQAARRARPDRSQRAGGPMVEMPPAVKVFEQALARPKAAA